MLLISKYAHAIIQSTGAKAEMLRSCGSTPLSSSVEGKSDNFSSALSIIQSIFPFDNNHDNKNSRDFYPGPLSLFLHKRNSDEGLWI